MRIALLLTKVSPQHSPFSPSLPTLLARTKQKPQPSLSGYPLAPFSEATHFNPLPRTDLQFAALQPQRTMAVLQMWPGLIVRVKVAGQPATEYDPPEDDENDPEDSTGQPASTRCYIESTSGLRYSVEAEITSDFKLSAPYQVVVLSVTIDGKFADGRYRFVVGENVVRPVTIEVDRIVEPAPAHVPGLGAQRFFTFAPVSASKSARLLTIHLSCGC